MLIGTHNSASYSFNFNVSFWTKRNKWEWLRMAAKVFSFAREKIIRLSKTQRKDIKGQLEAGARILDIRVSFANGIFYTSHTFCTDPLDVILNQIKTFLEAKSDRETDGIIVAISPDFINQGTLVGRENMLLDRVLDALKPVADGYKLVYKPLQISLDYYGSVAHMDTFTNYYYDVASVAQFKERFGETEFGDESILHCVLTPPTDVAKLRDVSLEAYAYELNPVVSYLLKERAAEGRQLPDVCIFDFFETGVSIA